MKAVTIVLVIVTSVVAQELKAFAPLHLNNIKQDYVGILEFSQSSSMPVIRVNGVLGALPQGKYIVMVLEENAITYNCNALGGVKRLYPQGMPFTLFYYTQFIDQGFDSITEVILNWGTLKSNRLNTLVGHTIAFYSVPPSSTDLALPGPIVACGLVYAAQPAGVQFPLNIRSEGFMRQVSTPL